ncbi:hypothetical protein RhiJN_22003 [Ceratobasidium sp. AG-Ba]|nr:hypothetical protein RhiJN_22003 [Ceratobasidium sp. AG-Ba]
MASNKYVRIGRALVKFVQYEGEALREGRRFPNLRLLKRLPLIPNIRLPKPLKRTPPSERNTPDSSREDIPAPPDDVLNPVVPPTDDIDPAQPTLVETGGQPTTKDIGVGVPEQPPPSSSPPSLPSPPRDASINSDVTVDEAPHYLRNKSTDTFLPPTWTAILQTVLTFHLYFLLFILVELAVLCFLYAFVFVLSLIGLKFATA